MGLGNLVAVGDIEAAAVGRQAEHWVESMLAQGRRWVEEQWVGWWAA